MAFFWKLKIHLVYHFIHRSNMFFLGKWKLCTVEKYMTENSKEVLKRSNVLPQKWTSDKDNRVEVYSNASTWCRKKIFLMRWSESVDLMRTWRWRKKPRCRRVSCRYRLQAMTWAPSPKDLLTRCRRMRTGKRDAGGASSGPGSCRGSAPRSGCSSGCAGQVQYKVRYLFLIYRVSGK